MPRGVPKAGKRKARWDRGLPRGNADLRRQARENPSLVNAQQVRFEEIKGKEEEPVQNETDEEIEARIRERFDIMLLMADATAMGQNNALIISGPPGLGKSHGVDMVLTQAENKGYMVERIKGFLRPTGLFRALYECKSKKSIIVFDDCDSVFLDDTCLNLLKTACDTTKKREISWRAEHRMEDQGGEKIPNKFEFEGTIIFITNYDFDKLIARNHRLTPHFEALISRSHYLDLTLKSRRDYLIRIKQVVSDGMLDSLGLSRKDAGTVMEYVETNVDKLRELSLRSVLKIATLLTCQRDCWTMIANATCLK